MRLFKKFLGFPPEPSPLEKLQEVFAALDNLSQNQVLSAFKEMLNDNDVQRLVQEIGYASHYCIFNPLKNMPKKHRLPALKAALENSGLWKSMHDWPFHFDDLIHEIIGSMEENEHFPAFQYVLRKFTENPRNRYSNLCAFIFIAPRFLSDRNIPEALRAILENPVMQQVMREEPSRTLYFVLHIIENLHEPFQSQAFKDTLASPSMRYTLAQEKSGSANLALAQDIYLKAANDRQRGGMAKALIGAIQSQVHQEQQGPVAYVTPLLDLEGTLVANFGKALSNEARMQRGQPPVSFFQISEQFNRAGLGWELRPVKTSDDQVKYSKLLPGNDNLLTRAIKSVGTQEVHAVVGHKTGNVNISIEPI